MTLTQRLTRAGLTFVLFGSVVALMPETSNAVSASTCGTGIVYALSESPSGPGLTAATLHAGSRDVLYAIQSVNGGAYTPISGQAVTTIPGSVQAGATTNASGAVVVRETGVFGPGTVTTQFPDGSTGTFNYTVGP